MKKTLVGTVLFTLFWPLSVLAEMKIDVAFSPSLDCEQKLVKLIDDSQDYIDVAVYAINNTPIMQALKNAHKRKVNIRILTDKLQASGQSSGVRDLYDFGIEIKVHSKNKLEHNKFAILTARLSSPAHSTGPMPPRTKTAKTAYSCTKNPRLCKNISLGLTNSGR